MAGNTQTVGVLVQEHNRQSDGAPPKLSSFAPLTAALSVDAPLKDEDDFPEGGLQAWLTMLGSFLVYFASFGVVNSCDFFQMFYQVSYLSDYSPTAISFIGTVKITLLYLSGSVAGALFDSYGLKVSRLVFLQGD